MNILFVRTDRFSKSYITKIVNQVALVSCQITPTWKIECKDFKDVIPMPGLMILSIATLPIMAYVDYYMAD